MAMISQAELEILVRCLTNDRMAFGILFGSSAVFIYDYLLTLDRELELVWRRKISLGSVTYFFARYTAFVASNLVLLPNSYSVSITNALSYLRFITILSAELILALRAWAIWERSRVILALLVCMTIAGIVPAIIVTIRDSSSSTVDDVVSGFPKCAIVVSSVKQLWVIPYVIIILYEISTLSITLVKIGRLYASIPKDVRSSLLNALRSDGIMYFMLMLVLGVFNIALVVQANDPQLRQSGSQLQTIIHSMVATRIVFHVTQLTSKDISKAGSSLQFTTILTTQIEMNDMSRLHGNESQDQNENHTYSQQ